ncbi:protein of unknown function [Rhodovastum atsumiense]|uniref:hypothetical protein n=1 Tax=Rhodovastum atsumiense TaxID=504468 RepID=UPI00139F293C|nr:hypothetical protein [Rhodovastum atsumiense]CAH2604004.1 protein of unknown function [Rhodovastum atsumiense]
MNAMLPWPEDDCRQQHRPIWTSFRFPCPGNPPDSWFRAWRALARVILYLSR